MRIISIAAVAAVISVAALPARAQVTFGVGAGVGTGSRGGTASGTHVVGLLEFKLPVLPGLRADGYLASAPAGVGKVSASLSAVWSAPIPVVTPYIIGGWGVYGVEKSSSQNGWNIGAGVRAKVGKGIFAEYRRHQRIARDLITFGIVF